VPSLIDWGIAERALSGEAQSGDLHFVKEVPAGVLVSVVDGLGHGAEAAAAAQTAVAALDRFSDEPVLQLLPQCHRALVGTRGVVMSVAFFDRAEPAMTWLGVGNVEGILLFNGRAARPARSTLIAPGGIVGSELPRLQAQLVPLAPGDTLIFASDGIKAGFADEPVDDASPQQLADRILTRFCKGTDDALVLVARYRGAAGAGP